MYRQMTPEEKLEYSAEVIEAIKKDGLQGSLEVVEKYKRLLSEENIIKNTTSNEENLVPTEPETKINEREFILKDNVQEASIYAAEHIPLVEEDLREQRLGQSIVPTSVEEPKAKTLERSKSSTPNPWGEAKTVSPGELNLQ